jgi:phenylalanyl-tRNA synthetase beta chain
MIVTRSWLNEFIDISNVSDEKLYETFNSIGLEVDSIQKVEIPKGVVVGEIISCEKHPDADKLNVCQIDVGSGDVRQIVCGASNVVDAKFVAVATVGAVLPGNFEIKDAVLRGVDSAGMVCSSSELGLPAMGKGIMILDESIGELKAGVEFGSYNKVADTIIELELTANRGDCLSIYGVARDLSSALGIDMKLFEYKQAEKMKLGIAREANIHADGEIDATLKYKLATLHSVEDKFVIDLRLAMVGIEADNLLDKMIAYTTHATGVILRVYNSKLFLDEDEKICVKVESKSKGIIEVFGKELVSIVGAYQSDESKAKLGEKLLFEASYIEPNLLSEVVTQNKIKCDELYYKTSRGSNHDLLFGFEYLTALMDRYSDINCYEGVLSVGEDREKEKLLVSASEVSTIIGVNIELPKIVAILQKLGFEISKVAEDTISVKVPLFRHDIKNIQDITEEIVRIVGINNIDAKPLSFEEKPRLNDTTTLYKAKKEIKNRAVGAGFYENISYVFSDIVLLKKYGFTTTKEELELANPIVEELNTLRSTILINLLNAVKRNVSYSKKSIPLFEIGAVFDEEREQKEVISIVYAGDDALESVVNAGKPQSIDFASFTSMLAQIIGEFELVECSYSNGLLHPYQSANIIKDGKVCGFVSKLHPIVQDEFDIPVCFIAEVELEAITPQHINAKAISKYQGVYKDLSIVLDKTINYYEVAKVIHEANIELLQEFYPIDIYSDEKLGDDKSLTVRFFIQSMEKTLQDSDIEGVVSNIIKLLEDKFSAKLR